MKNLTLAVVLLAGITLTGCLQNDGGTEVPSNLNNGDFSVTNPGDNGSGNNGGDGGVKPPDSEGPTTPTEPTTPDGFEINKGDVLTGSTNLLLDFYPPFSSGYTKISDNDTCTGGAWEGYVDSRAYAATRTNQNVTLGVQYRDYDGRISSCYTRKIYIDQAGPDIVFSKYPTAAVEEGSDVQVIFNVTDPGAGVDTVSCEVASVVKTCSPGQNTLTFAKLAGGTYKITVNAKDKLGNASSNSVSFTVSSMYKQMVNKVAVTENKKVDILFVIDNSGSMEYEQKSMASRTKNFIDVIKGLDWQIAVTTTDPRSEVTLGDGKLVPMYGKTNTYVINSSMSDTDAKTTLSNTLQRPETGSGSEQGIYVAYRAIERSLLSTTTANKKFIRSDAQLAVVVISDEDESADGYKNKPENFVKYIADTFGSQKAMSFHSVITRPDDKACLNGEGYSYGYRYDEISKMTGGVIGDVCATDYAAQVQGIAEGVRKTLKSFTLACKPVIDSMRSLLVLKDGQVYNGTRTINGLNVVFDDMLPAGNYEVYYSCLK